MADFLELLKINAAETRRIQKLIHETSAAALQEKSPENLAAWRDAAREFHATWDQLAFPGGIGREFELLQQGNLDAAERALLYLENPPYSFRSQYIAEKLRRRLNNMESQMPENLQARFDAYKRRVKSKKLERRKMLGKLDVSEQLDVYSGRRKLSDFKSRLG